VPGAVALTTPARLPTHDGPGWPVAGAPAPGTAWHRENKEVLWLGSVAVAVTNWPEATDTDRAAIKEALPLPSVVTDEEPR